MNKTIEGRLSYKERARFVKIHKWFKLGNLKIGFDTIVFNLGSATNCPSKKLGLCNLVNDIKEKRKNQRVCYACKMECYPNVLNYRENQLKYWIENTTAFIIAELIDILDKYKSKYNIKYLRFNESGDFHTLSDIQRMQRIADFTGLKIYTYTHRKDIINKLIKLGYKPTNNLIINLSDFKRKGFNTFKIVSEKTYNIKKRDGYKTCAMDCTKCSLCKYQHGQTIYVPEH